LLAIAPRHLPVAACRAVVNSLIKSRLLIEVAAPCDQLAMVWRKDGDGTPILIQVTDEGIRAIGIDLNEGRTARDTAPQGGEEKTPHQDDAVVEQTAPAAPEAPNMGSVNLREAAERLLAAWEETPPANADKDPIARAMDMLRNALSQRGARATGAPHKPREGTKQEVVLAMLRRPEGATVAQIAQAMNTASFINESDHGLNRRSSSVWAKYADALCKILLAWRSSRFSRSSAFSFSAISLGTPARLPLSTSARLTQSSSVCAEQPILAEIDNAAAQREGCSPS
jgi:hypothetical protein